MFHSPSTSSTSPETTSGIVALSHEPTSGPPPATAAAAAGRIDGVAPSKSFCQFPAPKNPREPRVLNPSRCLVRETDDV
eukprot:4618364-Prymnesium_polylepis.1